MATDADRGVDLVSVAKAGAQKYALLSRKIFRLRDANSIHTDLSTAFDMLTSIREIYREGDHADRWRDRAVLGLTYAAIILYARATKSGSDHRSTLDLRPKFTPEQKLLHEELCKLRDDAIAHFGPGEREGAEPWHMEGVFLPLDRPEDCRIVSLSRRVVFNPTFLGRMTAQVHRAMILSEREARERDHECVTEIDGLFKSDPNFVDFMKEHRVSFDEYFEKQEMANLTLHGERFGSLSEVLYFENSKDEDNP